MWCIPVLFGQRSASAAVPGSSGRQQREEGASCSSRRCCRLSSSRTGRTSKRRPRDRSPSPVRSSRCREASYRSSSEEEERVESPPPTAGHVPGGTPGVSRPTSASDCSPRLGPKGCRPRSSAPADRSRSGFGGHLSSPPPGGAPFNIQPVVVVRGFKRQQVAALTNFVGCFFSLVSSFFFSLPRR